MPLAVFWVALLIGFFLCAMYSSMIGQILFNSWAVTLGGLIGLISAAVLTHAEVIPYSALWPLILASLSTSILTFVFPHPRIFKYLGTLIWIVHILQTLIIVVAIVYSLGAPWLRPLVVVMSITGFIIWSPSLVGACPLTLFEAKIRNSEGRETQIEEQGFIRYYVQKLFKVKFSRTSYSRFLKILALIYFCWLIINFFIYGHI
jgi:hypothetical protein